MSKQKKTELYPAREVAAVLNNAVIMTARSHAGEIEESRLRKLSEYAKAFIEVALEHVEEGAISPIEVTHILAAGALTVYTSKVQGRDKLPGSKEAKKLYDRAE